MIGLARLLLMIAEDIALEIRTSAGQIDLHYFGTILGLFLPRRIRNGVFNPALQDLIASYERERAIRSRERRVARFRLAIWYTIWVVLLVPESMRAVIWDEIEQAFRDQLRRQ
jgi:hypothetical protein